MAATSSSNGDERASRSSYTVTPVSSSLSRDASSSNRSSHYTGSGTSDAVPAPHVTQEPEMVAAASSSVLMESAATRLPPPASPSPGTRWQQLPAPPAAPADARATTAADTDADAVAASEPTTSALPPSLAPLVYLSTKAISSVQAPGVLNWERVNGLGDREVFAIASDGVAVVRDGVYHVTVEVAHSEPRHSYKRVFRVWAGAQVLGQCVFPVRTKHEVALSIWEQRAHLPAGALVRVEFLAGGVAFHESRLVLRLMQQ